MEWSGNWTFGFLIFGIGFLFEARSIGSPPPLDSIFPPLPRLKTVVIRKLLLNILPGKEMAASTAGIYHVIWLILSNVRKMTKIFINYPRISKQFSEELNEYKELWPFALLF